MTCSGSLVFGTSSKNSFLAEETQEFTSTKRAKGRGRERAGRGQITERRVQSVDKLKTVVTTAQAPHPSSAISCPRFLGKLFPHLKIVHNTYQVVVRISTSAKHLACEKS